MTDTPINDQLTEMRYVKSSILSAAAVAQQRETIETVLGSLDEVIENLFDEIHRLGSRIDPILNLPEDTASEGMKSPDVQYHSDVRGNLKAKIARIHNACRDLSNYTARVDL